jgi:hypothetical protein
MGGKDPDLRLKRAESKPFSDEGFSMHQTGRTGELRRVAIEESLNWPPTSTTKASTFYVHAKLGDVPPQGDENARERQESG